MRMLSFVALGLLLLMQQPSPTQTSKPVQPELKSHPEWPAADPLEVATPEATARAFFAQISTAAGGKLDQPHLKSLFLPSGRIALTQGKRGGGSVDAIFITPGEYAESSDQMTATNGFFDRVVALHTQQFGDIAQVFATYESRGNKNDEKPFMRGLKGFDMLRCNDRWYIAYVSWDRERKDLPIPETLLRDGAK